ncbi:MAG TPA: DUF255 domain-containing protein, partial [Fimbriimonadaceae bacterium]|nr:DUF255 domain-containing protein [Fimbriimonadaceae bacterium]
MARPSYGVVSAFAVIISLVGVATKFGAPLIPPQPENSLARSTGEFLQQGGQQRIDWRPLSPQLFGEAKRLDRPVMLVLGAIWSHDGRAIDRLIFTDPDIQLYLARNFLCARVDLDESPEWQTAFLPVHRANFHTRVGFQIWFLAPDGEVFDFVGSRSSGLEIDPNAFQKELIQVRSTLARMQDPEGGESVPGERQRADRNLLLNSDSQVPDLDGHLKMVASMSDRERGGFQNDGYRSVRASPWLTLVSTGHVDVARVSLDPVVRSSVVDWLDGGFFRLNNSYDWYVLQFDKLAVQNAEMMYLCALVGLLDKDPFYELIAKRTFDSLTGEFVHAGQIATCRVGDETSLKRSVRSSFAVRDFRRIWGTGTLNADESDWARQVLGLSVDKNEPMVIRVKRPELLLRDMATAETVLQKLRKRKEAAPKRFSTRPRADVNGRVIAKLLACA